MRPVPGLRLALRLPGLRRRAQGPRGRRSRGRRREDAGAPVAGRSRAGLVPQPHGARAGPGRVRADRGRRASVGGGPRGAAARAGPARLRQHPRDDRPREPGGRATTSRWTTCGSPGRRWRSWPSCAARRRARTRPAASACSATWARPTSTRSCPTARPPATTTTSSRTWTPSTTSCSATRSIASRTPSRRGSRRRAAGCPRSGASRCWSSCGATPTVVAARSRDHDRGRAAAEPPLPRRRPPRPARAAGARTPPGSSSPAAPTSRSTTTSTRTTSSIYHKGYLAIDTGADYTDTESPHYLNHYRRTVAHNTMLVYQPGETLLLGREPVAGGQRRRPAHGLVALLELGAQPRGLAAHARPLGPRAHRGLRRPRPGATSTRAATARAPTSPTQARALRARAALAAARRDVLFVLDRVREPRPVVQEGLAAPRRVASRRSRRGGRGREPSGQGGTSYRRGRASSPSRTARAACACTPSCRASARSSCAAGPGFEFWTPGDEYGGAWGSGQELAARSARGRPAARRSLPEEDVADLLGRRHADSSRPRTGARWCRAAGGSRSRRRRPARDDVFLHALEIGDVGAPPLRIERDRGPRPGRGRGGGRRGGALRDRRGALDEGEATLPDVASRGPAPGGPRAARDLRAAAHLGLRARLAALARHAEANDAGVIHVALDAEGRPAAGATARARRRGATTMTSDRARPARRRGLGGGRRFAVAARGRPRPPMPKITKPVMFDTPEADAILAALQVFPPDNPWNQDISALPVHKDSARDDRLASAPDKPLEYNLDMGFIIVPADQKRVDVKILDYPDESDPGPFPLPDNAPIENWPLAAQREHEGAAQAGADPRAVPARGRRRPPRHPRRSRQREVPRVLAGEAHRRGLAGVERGHLEPARRARCGPSGGPRPTPPACRSSRPSSATTSARAAWSSTPCASRCAGRAAPTCCPPPTGPARSKDANLPRMGERFRLRKDFDVSGFPPHVQAILKGLKTYGMFVADNGSDWWMSIAPDRRLQGLESLHRVKGSDFEVVETGARSVDGRRLSRARHEALHGRLRRARRGARTARPRRTVRGARIPRLELAACCDVDAARAERYRRALRLRAQPTPTPRRCSTPRSPTPWCWSCPETRDRRRWRTASSSAAVPLLIEKPPGRTVAEVDRLIARRRGGRAAARAAPGGLQPPVRPARAGAAPPARRPRRRRSDPAPPLRDDARGPARPRLLGHRHPRHRRRALPGRRATTPRVRFRYQEQPALGPGRRQHLHGRGDGLGRHGAPRLLSRRRASSSSAPPSTPHGHTFFLHVPMWDAFDSPGPAAAPRARAAGGRSRAATRWATAAAWELGGFYARVRGVPRRPGRGPRAVAEPSGSAPVGGRRRAHPRSEGASSAHEIRRAPRRSLVPALAGPRPRRRPGPGAPPRRLAHRRARAAAGPCGGPRSAPTIRSVVVEGCDMTGAYITQRRAASPGGCSASARRPSAFAFDPEGRERDLRGQRRRSGAARTRAGPGRMVYPDPDEEHRRPRAGPTTPTS